MQLSSHFWGRSRNRRLGAVSSGKPLSLLVLLSAMAITAALTVTACGDTKAVGDSGRRPLELHAKSTRRPLVRQGDLLVGKRSGRLVVLKQSGKLVRRVPRFVAPNDFQGVDLAPDRRHAFVSVYMSNGPARLYEIDLATGARHKLASAITPALSRDHTRLAYVSTDRRVDIVYRTALVIREVRTSRTKSISLGPDVPMGTPPELVINWSPDSRRIAVFDGNRTRLVDVGRASDVRSQPSVAGPSLAPVFLNGHSLVVLADCCIGPQHIVAVDLRSGVRRAFATLSSPPEGIRWLRPGVLLVVTALNELALVSRGHFRVIARAVTAATG
jgi:hypothetical protein